MKKSIGSVVIFFIVIKVFAGAVWSQEKVKPVANISQGIKDPAELETFVDGIMAIHLRDKHIAGATFSAVKDGKIFLAKGYGFADAEKKIPVKPDKTLFRPGSVSKLFTWTAMMQLFEQGKIDLNADVNTYLKDFKIPETFPEPITMTNLLTHTPGFEEKSVGIGAKKVENLVPLRDALAKHMPVRVRPPGKLTSYSNYGAALAGYIVEVVSGFPFEEYVEKNIFKPLGMDHSTFRQPLPVNLAADMSVGYRYKDGVYKAEEFELINGMAPAGSLSTTGLDIAKFMIAHLQNGEYEGRRILKEETAKLMHAQLFTHDPRLDGNAHGFWEWRYNNVYTIGHGGDTLLFHSLLVLIPEQNAGFFVSYNSIGGGGSPRTQLMESIMDRYFPMRELAEIRTVPDFKKRAKRLVGVYKLARVNSSSFEKLLELVMTVRVKASRNNTLIISSVGSEKKQWVETEPLVFREKDGQETVIFREDSKGRITHLFLGGVPEIACIKLAWYESPTSLLLLEAIAVILFLSTLVWPIRALSRVAWKRKHEEKCAPKVFRWIAGGMSAAYVLFIIGLLMVLGNYMALIFGVPPLLKAVLVLPIIGAVLTVVALILMVTVWMRKYWSVCGRVHYTLVVLASIVFILLLYYWNLLGFQF